MQVDWPLVSYGTHKLHHTALKCFRISSSNGRFSRRCCRSSSRWPGQWPRFNLPLAQYPQITPPSIMVMCTYPGADAQVVADSVAAPIEQQINGVEDMMYMVSQSNNDGSLHPDRHLQAGRQPQLRPGAGAEPHQPGPAAAARRGQAGRRHHPQAQPGHPAGRRHLLAQGALRPALPEQLLPRSRSRTRSPASTASATASSSASKITACGSGSTPNGWRR